MNTWTPARCNFSRMSISGPTHLRVQVGLRLVPEQHGARDLASYIQQRTVLD